MEGFYHRVTRVLLQLGVLCIVVSAWTVPGHGVRPAQSQGVNAELGNGGGEVGGPAKPVLTIDTAIRGRELVAIHQ